MARIAYYFSSILAFIEFILQGSYVMNVFVLYTCKLSSQVSSPGKTYLSSGFYMVKFLDLIGVRNSGYRVRLGIEWDDDGVRIRLGVEAFLGSYMAF